MGRDSTAGRNQNQNSDKSPLSPSSPVFTRFSFPWVITSIAFVVIAAHTAPPVPAKVLFGIQQLPGDRGRRAEAFEVCSRRLSFVQNEGLKKIKSCFHPRRKAIEKLKAETPRSIPRGIAPLVNGGKVGRQMGPRSRHVRGPTIFQAGRPSPKRTEPPPHATISNNDHIPQAGSRKATTDGRANILLQ